MGRLFLSTGKSHDALPMLREAIEIERRAWPEGHADIADAETLLGENLMMLGEFEEAEPFLLRSYPVIREQRGARHRQTQRALRRIIELYDAWGKPGQADEYRALAPALDRASA